MSSAKSDLLSVVVPLYNEQAGLASFQGALARQLTELDEYEFEIIYCNDGSIDGTLAGLRELAAKDKRIRVVSLSRNFGKEIATTAGLQAARGRAVLTLDADEQHPIELLPRFIAEWREGAKVVIGLRATSKSDGWVRRLGSRLFYKLYNQVTGLGLAAGATDFRLIDRVVVDDFNQLTEHNRITRGLIDWLGYPRAYINFDARARLHGKATYSFGKLCKLEVDSVISLSSSPLYVVAYIGAVVLPVSLLLGLVMVLNDLLGDPLLWHATGGAYVMVLVLFLIGILLLSQGIIGLYLSHIHSETQNRPLYIVDREASVGL